MDYGGQAVMDNSEPVPATGLDNITILTGLPAGSIGLVPSFPESTFTFNLTSLPLTLASNYNSMAKDQRDLAVSSPDLTVVAQNTIETLVRISDGGYSLQSSDPLKSDPLAKQAFEDKGLSPLNILNTSAYTDTGQASPGPGLQFRSAGNGGDTMLSAINYTDNEMLTDSAFDINNSAPPGLGHLDDNLFSGLGNPASTLQGQGSNAFDLFDNSVSDPLSPFGDAGLPMDGSSLQAMDNDRTSESTVDESKPASKSSNSGSKKTLQQQQQAPNSQSGMESPGKCSVQCPVCGKQFNNVSALAKHRLTHSDVRKYLCTVCNKGFKRQDHLNGHQMTHLDKKPFGCPLENCDKGYCDSRSLRRHLEAHHHLTTDVAQAHVLTSMAASGITPPAQRNGKGKSADTAALAAAAKAAQAASATSSGDGGAPQRIISSPSYSASSTPSPNQSSGSSHNQFFHFEVQANKAATAGGSVAVKVDTEAGDLGLKKLQEVTLQRQNNIFVSAAEEQGQGQQPQYQVQFQLQQPSDLLAVMQAQQLLQQQQQQQQFLHAHQQQTAAQGMDSKGATQKKTKAAKEAKLKAQELSPQSNEVGGLDSGISSQSEASWQERAQVYNFVGTPGSGEQSPTSVSGELSPGVTQVSPNASPGVATPSSPLPTSQQRLSCWSSGHTEKKKDRDSDKGEGPVQCSVCERRFKNLPALNGHMRLHGGYLKKEKEDGKRSNNKKSVSTSSPSSTSSSPTTPTDMGPPPPPSRPLPLPAHSPLPPCSPQPQPSSPSVQVPSGLVVSSTTSLPSSTQQIAASSVADLQTFFLANSQTLQQVGISQLSAEMLQHQQQQLQQHIELQQMAALLKEEQDIRSLEEQLKQNIHEQQLNSLVSTPAHTPTPPQLQTTAMTLTQVNESLADVTQALSPLRVASPQTQQAEQIQRLVDSFQQVEELHRQQKQQQILQLPQLTAQQIEQIQQQHSQLGLPPLQPAQLQQLLQEQLLQQHHQQSQSLASLQLGHGQLIVQHQPIIPLTNGTSVTSCSAPTSGTQTNSMTPGLPGGVLSNGQQLQLGSGTIVSQPSSTVATFTSVMQPTSNLVLSSTHQTSAGVTPSLPVSSRPTEHFVLANQQLRVSTAETLSVSKPLSIHESTMSQLIVPLSGFEGSVGSELLISSSHRGEMLSGSPGDTDKLPGFQSFQSLSSLSIPSSTHMALDSIKQDVMLSSAIQSAPHTLGLGDHPSERLLGGHNEMSHAVPSKVLHSEIKRRLSADLESCRKSSSSLTITSLINKGPAIVGHFSKRSADNGNGNIISPPLGRVRVRSKSGDVHKFMRSKSVDHSLMRERSNTEESIYRPRKRSGDETFIGRSKNHGEEYLSQSDGASVFRNPSSLPSPFKIKRKHRPTPLFIPPTLSSFQSRLRSPRLWDGGEGKGKGHTPPPYTPPPMLSPIRSGSGLFWSMQGARPLTPHSAPVSARLSLSRRGSMGDSLIDPTAKDSDEESPPETDIKPHVNVGPQYQADLPPFNVQHEKAMQAANKEDLMWDPSIRGMNSDEDVQSYQDFACCAAVKGNGSNVEYALHLLYLANGDIQTAMLMLMGDPPILPAGHGLLTYRYQESESWSGAEIQAFHDGLNEFDKDFFNVSRKIATKSVKECIQFYYLWKKVCPDDYKRLRNQRRKRSQNSLYNLRSQPVEGVRGEPTTLLQDSALTPGHDEYFYDGSDSDTEEHAGYIKAEHLPVDLTMETEISSLTSSPTAIHPHSLGRDHMTLVLQDNNKGISPMITTPPLALQPTPAPIMTSLASGLPIVTQCPTPEPVQTFACDFPGCTAVLTSRQSLTRHTRKHIKELKEDNKTQPAAPFRPKPRPSTPSKSPIYDQNGEEIFPCKICDRVFTKVKSRSAHMKSHKVAEPEKKMSPSPSAFLPTTVPSPMSDL